MTLALPLVLALPLMAVAGLATLGGSAARAAGDAAVTILTGPNRTAVSEIFGPRLAEALQPAIAAELQIATGSRDNLEAVAADPALVAFSQFDIYERFVAERGLADVLEYYGNIPICLFAAARIGSPVTLGLDGRAPGFAVQTVDTGPSNGDAALTFDLLRERVPALRDLEVEHRGWSRALARVAQGQLDLFVFVEYPNPEAPLIGDVLDSDRVVLLENIAEVLGPIPLAEAPPYLVTQASISRETWLEDRYVAQTLCTSLGIVVHRDGDPYVLEAVVHAVTSGGLMSNGGGSWWQDLVARFEGWIDEGRRLMAPLLDQL